MKHLSDMSYCLDSHYFPRIQRSEIPALIGSKFDDYSTAKGNDHQQYRKDYWGIAYAIFTVFENNPELWQALWLFRDISLGNGNMQSILEDWDFQTDGLFVHAFEEMKQILVE